MESVIPYLAPAFSIATGLYLLCVGARLLKPAIGLGAGLLGAGAGFLLAPEMSLSFSPFIVAIIFGVVSAVLAVAISKFAILVILAVSFAIVLPIITWQVASLGDGSKVINDVVEVATEDKKPTQSTNESTNGLSSPELKVYKSVSEMSQRVWSMVRFGKNRILATWDVIPTGSRFIVAGAAVAGLLLGLLIATFLPYFSAAIVTAAGGSILLRIGVGQATNEVWGTDSLTSMNSTLLLLVMAGIALAGFGFQLTYSRKNAATQKAD
ncbi:MAG: hypothetical protein HOC27_03730 [Phycisphaerae bacterium]|jgi:hypothetical protein|nr:hypothetical protein [Phycisphaerae bacterium]